MRLRKGEALLESPDKIWTKDPKTGEWFQIKRNDKNYEFVINERGHYLFVPKIPAIK